MTYTPTFDASDMYQNAYWYVSGNTYLMMIT
jgi:hypothetical protein